MNLWGEVRGGRGGEGKLLADSEVFQDSLRCTVASVKTHGGSLHECWDVHTTKVLNYEKQFWEKPRHFGGWMFCVSLNVSNGVSSSVSMCAWYWNLST